MAYIFGIYTLAVVVVFVSRTTGECLHSGKLYLNHTVWLPEPCSLCTCQDPVSVCEPIRCRDPDCDFSQGEYLEIPADGCCPECVHHLSPCKFEGQIIPHNTDWNPKFCVSCSCLDGKVACQDVACQLPRCKPGEISQKLPGQCCAQCIPAGRSCTYDGQRYQDGSEWAPLPCTKCVCRDSQAKCYPIQCGPVSCPQGQRLEQETDNCCPACMGGVCTDAQIQYRDGEQWSRDSCTLCVCLGGTSVCTERECFQSVQCQKHERLITRAGECCPECVPDDAACSGELPLRYSGDIWNISDCEFCICNNGQVHCHTAVCEHRQCGDYEAEIHKEKKCCSECLIPPHCQFGETIYQEEDTWHPDPCSVCNCEDGEAVCYQQPCPRCPEKSIPIIMPGDCCGQCSPVECHADCATCEPHKPDYCTSCRVSGKLVQYGQCVQSCRDGFYPAANGKCKNCHDNCKTCSDESEYHCLTCPPGLLWREGECVTHCGPGFYLHNSQCLACHPRCKMCSGPGRDQCLACSHSGHILQIGQCVNNCHGQHYIRNKECKACPPVCGSCLSDSPTCASCHPGAVFHQGQCMTGCPAGFFPNQERVCVACHPSCKSCNGASSDDCTSCNWGAELISPGMCKRPCPPGQYLRPNGNCHNCELGCASCLGTWDGDTAVCTSCVDSMLWPHGSQCLMKCPLGNYLQGGICRECGSGCLECETPSICVKCRPPFLLSDGFCVYQCGQAHFADEDKSECTDCPRHCMKCVNSTNCNMCNSHTYLREGECVQRCGEGFYTDDEKRICQGNHFPPQLQILSQLQVEEGGKLTIPADILYLSDSDTDDDYLRIYVIDPPSNGFLVTADRGDDRVLSVEDYFTLSDMRKGKIRFIHSIDKGRKGRVVLKASDRQLFSEDSVLYIQAISREPLTLETNNVVMATGGEATVLTSDIIHIHSVGNKDIVSISVRQGPLYGTIKHEQFGMPVTTFTLKDLEAGNIAYHHDSSSQAGSDLILMQAFDGYFVLNFLLKVEIRPKDSHIPVLVHNKATHVVSGSMLQFTSDLLMAKSLAEEGSDIIYTLVPPVDNPKEGDLLMVVRVPSSGVGRGWESIGDGNMAAKMFRFYQRDIDDGRIWYKHRSTWQKSDVIYFEVTDTSDPPHVLRGQEFHITVIEDEVQALAEPTLAPGIRLGMTVFENQLLPLTRAYLVFEDSDTPDQEIIYTITTSLASGEGTLEHVDHPFRPMFRFTQDDINNNKIVYRPPDTEIGAEEMLVSFTFVVSDGNRGRPTQENKFTIRIVPVNNMPPTFLNSKPTLTVFQGSSVPLDQSVIALSDPDTPFRDIKVTLVSEPQTGSLEKSTDGLRAILRRGDVFTYQEIMTSMFQYVHDGNDRKLTDMFELSASDGLHQSPVTVNVTVVKVDQSAPFMLSSASCSVTVQEGGRVTLTRDHIAFEDEDDTNDQLTITLDTVPQHGELLFGSHSSVVQRGHTFTQDDINIGYISYMADKEVGSQPIRDVMSFNVSDLSGNLLPTQAFTALIEPNDNQSPRVHVGPEIEVYEGSSVLLTGDYISGSDPDSPVSHLIVVIDMTPSFGVIQDNSPDDGSEISHTRNVTSFPLQDLLDGYVTYVQSDHKNKEPAWDGFLFHITDGTNTSPTNRFNISILAVNDEEPLIVMEQLFVQEGGAVLLTNASLYIVDIDSHDTDLIFTLETPPSYGSLKRKEFILDPVLMARILKQGFTFTYQDVLNELIVYEHNGGEITTDSFTLHLTDGEFNGTQVMRVVVGLLNDETPRVTINRGLRVQAGSSMPIKSKDLRATDIDSDDSQIKFTVTQNPSAGVLRLNKNGQISSILAQGPRKSFIQSDIDKGYLEFVHTAAEMTGNIIFKFTLSDPEGNDLIDQSFHITILEDRFPPSLVSFNELIVIEGFKAKLTTQYLSFTDVDSEPALLRYVVITAPTLGHLERSNIPGVPITGFSQSDLAANSVVYVHTSTEEIYTDQFTFTVTDGTNQITRTFYINITPVDDSIPVVQNNGLWVQEGVRKLITEFDLKAVDSDTKENMLVFHIVQLPIHGSLDLGDGEHYRPTNTFTMEDIYENHVSYQHDGSETVQDNFSFTVSDGTNRMFAMQQDGRGDITIGHTSPQKFDIEIQPLDDGSPVLQTNLGLQFLEYTDLEVFNIITSAELKVFDYDTLPEEVIFIITMAPKHGHLEIASDNGVAINSFTQADIDSGIIRYVLSVINPTVTRDSFMFDILDTKPNRVRDNLFHIIWSVISFEKPSLNISETEGVIQIPVIRRGNLKQYSIVHCQTHSGSATSDAIRPGTLDYVQHTGQVQFDEWQDTKVCTVIINDDSIFEGPETFFVELSQPTYSLLGGNRRADITIYDIEDEPVIQFSKDVYVVNESDDYLSAQITRKGDLSNSVSVICFTSSVTATGSSLVGLESGSDFISRGQTNAYRTVFPPGVTTASCDVKIVDDSEYEISEQFELELMAPSTDAILGPLYKATVVIEGPSDESTVFFSLPTYHFAEDSGLVEIEILREGSDLSHSSVVWCATKLSEPPSATPGQDYVPTSSQITFSPHQTEQRCQLNILDDNVDSRLEGNETFVAFLSSTSGSILSHPYSATIIIYDSHLDVPVMQFLQDRYFVDESDMFVSVEIMRSGDVSYESSVICYTRQQTALVMMDYEERFLSEASRIFFKPGEKRKNCTVAIVDDDDFEPEEVFLLRLGQPRGTDKCEATLGEMETTTVTITNQDDVPTLQFEEIAYSVNEPSSPSHIETIIVRVVRTGDLNTTSSIRVSTRDGSAVSGIDYNPKSQILDFQPGVKSLDFPVEVLYNSDIEWHESFSIVLETQDSMGAVIGPIQSLAVTILDNEVSGSLVLPAPPMVVSLLNYDDVDSGPKTDPSPGYPLVCVTPCDLRYPTYSLTHSLCHQSEINQSNVIYSWEVAMPKDHTGSKSPFVRISDNTVFTSVNKMVLESIYFRPNFRIRCIAQPINRNGNPGIPLKSKSVTIGLDNGVCKAAIFSGNSNAYHAQSFLASLEYVGPDDSEHPNTVHITVKVPHQDGMLPLISTSPLHNLRFLLSEPIYRQQHVCSNLVTPNELVSVIDTGFLDPSFPPLVHGPGYSFPYQFDNHLRENNTLLLYKHLNLKSCVWTFDVWYHMTDLVDTCGGRIISDFQVSDSGKTYLTIRVPLYVSYLYATAPVGWGSLEHRTEMEFSFYYDTILWKSGLQTTGKLSGHLQVLRIMIGEDGKLVIDFKTQPNFRGLYVLEHDTLLGFHSRVLAPEDRDISFDLALLWGQQTFDSPHQLWRATSNYNLKDYTGAYSIELIPCIVKFTQPYTSTDAPIPCTAQQPQEFEVPISFQQTNRPVPLVYSLNTQFQLTNNKHMFLLDPVKTDLPLTEYDYNGAFSEGQKIYGRVLWAPEQDLKDAYRLTIEKVFLCTGRDGYIPTYDPTGDVYKTGPQFGCVQHTQNLLYRFLILDRGSPDVVDLHFNSIPFKAEFASNSRDYMALQNFPGVDGFTLSVDPLYMVMSGHQWFLQVLYIIGSSDPSRQKYRNRRSAMMSVSKRDAVSENLPWHKNVNRRNGTNMQQIHLNFTERKIISKENPYSLMIIILPVVLGIIFVACVIIIVVLVRRRRKQKFKIPNRKSNIEIAEQNSIKYRNNLRTETKTLNTGNRIKNTVIYSGDKGNLPVVRIKDVNLHKPKKKDNNSGTEV